MECVTCCYYGQVSRGLRLDSWIYSVEINGNDLKSSFSRVLGVNTARIGSIKNERRGTGDSMYRQISQELCYKFREEEKWGIYEGLG